MFLTLRACLVSVFLFYILKKQGEGENKDKMFGYFFLKYTRT